MFEKKIYDFKTSKSFPEIHKMNRTFSWYTIAILVKKLVKKTLWLRGMTEKYS